MFTSSTNWLQTPHRGASLVGGQNEQNLINATDIPQKNCVMFVKFSCKHKRLGNHSPKGLNRIVVLITLLLSSFYINLANQQQILEFKFDFSLSFCPL